MARRVRKLWFQLLRRRGFDILVTHAPAYELNAVSYTHLRQIVMTAKVVRRVVEGWRPLF